MMALTVTTYNQAHHFRFCLGGGGKRPQGRTENKFRATGAKIFFERKSSYTPPKNSFLLGFCPLWNENPSFFVFCSSNKTKNWKKFKRNGNGWMLIKTERRSTNRSSKEFGTRSPFIVPRKGTRSRNAFLSERVPAHLCTMVQSVSLLLDLLLFSSTLCWPGWKDRKYKT